MVGAEVDEDVDVKGVGGVDVEDFLEKLVEDLVDEENVKDAKDVLKTLVEDVVGVEGVVEVDTEDIAEVAIALQDVANVLAEKIKYQQAGKMYLLYTVISLPCILDIKKHILN